MSNKLEDIYKMINKLDKNEKKRGDEDMDLQELKNVYSMITKLDKIEDERDAEEAEEDSPIDEITSPQRFRGLIRGRRSRSEPSSRDVYIPPRVPPTNQLRTISQVSPATDLQRTTFQDQSRTRLQGFPGTTSQNRPTTNQPETSPDKYQELSQEFKKMKQSQVDKEKKSKQQIYSLTSELKKMKQDSWQSRTQKKIIEGQLQKMKEDIKKNSEKKDVPSDKKPDGKGDEKSPFVMAPTITETLAKGPEIVTGEGVSLSQVQPNQGYPETHETPVTQPFSDNEVEMTNQEYADLKERILLKETLKHQEEQNVKLNKTIDYLYDIHDKKIDNEKYQCKQKEYHKNKEFEELFGILSDDYNNKLQRMNTKIQLEKDINLQTFDILTNNYNNTLKSLKNKKSQRTKKKSKNKKNR